MQTLYICPIINQQKMKKILLIASIATVLASCGRSYIVRSVETNNYIYMDGSQIGQDHKAGDTIRMESAWRIDSVTVAKTLFTGVVVDASKKD